MLCDELGSSQRHLSWSSQTCLICLWNNILQPPNQGKWIRQNSFLGLLLKLEEGRNEERVWRRKVCLIWRLNNLHRTASPSSAHHRKVWVHFIRYIIATSTVRVVAPGPLFSMKLNDIATPIHYYHPSFMQVSFSSQFCTPMWPYSTKWMASLRHS